MDGGSRLHHGTERLIVVNSRTLSEDLENLAGLVSIQRTVYLSLMYLDPLISHHIAVWRTGHQIPGVIGKKDLVLSIA